MPVPDFESESFGKGHICNACSGSRSVSKASHGAWIQWLQGRCGSVRYQWMTRENMTGHDVVADFLGDRLR